MTTLLLPQGEGGHPHGQEGRRARAGGEEGGINWRRAGARPARPARRPASRARVGACARACGCVSVRVGERARLGVCMYVSTYAYV